MKLKKEMHSKFMKHPQIKRSLDLNFKETGNEYCYWDFSDIHEYLEIAAIEQPRAYVGQSSRDGGEDFTGTKNFTEAYEQAMYGWKIGLEAAQNIERDFKISFDDILPKQDMSKNIIHDVEGEIFNPDKFYQGDPEHMGKFITNEESKVTRGNKFQRLVINGTIACYIDKNVLFQAGVIYNRLINAMELHGFQVEVVTRFSVLDSMSFKRGPLALVTDVLIKQFEETLDEDKLIFHIASPSNLRRLWFSICENSPDKFQRRIVGGYGSVTEYTQDMLLKYGEDGTIFLPSINANLSKEQTLNIVRQKVSEKFNPRSDHFAV